MTRAAFFILAMLATWTLARADVPAPNSIVIVACRVDDLTGQPGRHDPNLAARDWRDLELHINSNQEYECKRELIADLQDIAEYAPSAPKDLIPLNPDFSDFAQCSRVGVMLAQAWNEKHKGWGVVAVGCPVPIVADKNGDGYPDTNELGQWDVVGWKLPDCPTYLPGTQNRMKCVYDESEI